MRGKLYSMHKRRTQKKQIWYVQFKQVDGTYGTAKSTGCTNKPNAESWVQNYLSRGQIVQKEHVRFSLFVVDFFEHDGEYAKIKRIKKQQRKVVKILWTGESKKWFGEIYNYIASNNPVTEKKLSKIL